MHLTTIGTGTAAPSAERVNAGHLVEAGEVRLLMDCGSGVVHRMAALGVEWTRITHLAITHFDADHVSDIATLLVAWRWGTLPPRSEPAELIGPPGTRSLLTRMGELFGGSVSSPDYPFEVRELLPDGEIELAEGVVLGAHKVPHTEESVAYSVRRGRRRLVYTGDTGPSAALGEWARDCDLLLAECSLPDEMAIPTHLTPARCAELAASAEPAMLVLTHFYPPVERVDIPAVIGERFHGPVALATDGWAIEIEEI
jgi:ribonuclease BN (tRNA processing enzyme)